MKLFTDVSFPTEIQDVAKLFFADVLLCSPEQAECSLTHTCADGVYTYVAQALGQSAVRSVSAEGDGLQSVRLQKRYAKLAMYEVLCRGTGKSMPWGSLTGIRPTRLACQLQSEGADWQKTFVELLGVSPEKTALTADILQCQKGLRDYREGCADLYVGIPFCVSRCSYCSFTGGEIGKMQKYVQPYVDVLRREVRETVQFAKSRGIKLNNVYFGGGTPTSLSARQLENVLSEITFAPVEFTVEAGRPDTIDGEKLRVLKDHGVHRISVNPQTFNQSVLDAVGRKHTVQAIYDSFAMAKKAGFTVNMDLIAGLPTETYEMFRHSVDCAVGLQPENFTVHTFGVEARHRPQRAALRHRRRRRKNGGVRPFAGKGAGISSLLYVQAEVYVAKPRKRRLLQRGPAVPVQHRHDGGGHRYPRLRSQCNFQKDFGGGKPHRACGKRQGRHYLCAAHRRLYAKKVCAV